MKTKPLLNKREYQTIVKKAHEFAYILQGDAGYTSGSSNRLALENMLLGWISTQLFFRRFSRSCIRKKQSDDSFLVFRDAVNEAVNDAVETNEKFYCDDTTPSREAFIAELLPNVVTGIATAGEDQKQWFLGMILRSISPGVYAMFCNGDTRLEHRTIEPTTFLIKTK